MDNWLVLMSGSKVVDEIRRYPEEQLSFADGVEYVRFRYVLRLPVPKSLSYVPIARPVTVYYASRHRERSFPHRHHQGEADAQPTECAP